MRIKHSVEDEGLRVYGVNGPRVIDASIMPLETSSHPQGTVYAVAEQSGDDFEGPRQLGKGIANDA